MTDDDKTLADKLRAWAPLIINGRGGSGAALAVTRAASRLEALSAENERLHILLSVQPSTVIAPDPLLRWVIK